MFSFPVTVGPSALCSAAIPLGTQPPANGRLRRWKSTNKIYRQTLSKTRSNQGSPAVVGPIKMKWFGFRWSIPGDTGRRPRLRLFGPGGNSTTLEFSGVQFT
jgi:hypothetical protein